MTTTTCTVITTATGGRCGAPAVVTFRSVITGETMAECAEHAAPGAPTPTGPAMPVGSFVHVRHAGIVKTGTVVGTGPKRVRVEVPTPHGRRSSLVISVPVGEVTIATSRS